MATVYLGYNRGSNGPDLALVGVGEQLVSHIGPNSPSLGNSTNETIRITSISAYVGHYDTGAATGRFGIYAASSSSAAPGALLAVTQEFTTTVRYVDAAGGAWVTAYMTMPYDLAPGQTIAVGIAARNNRIGVAMYEAQDISQPNENFYRKSINGTTMESASDSAVTNQGQLAVRINGETNQAPNAPSSLDPNQPAYAISIGRWPYLSFIHNDPDGDNANHIWIQVQTADGSTTMWTFNASTSVASGSRTGVTYTPSNLEFYGDGYRWRAKVRDVHGVESAYSDWAYFTIRHNNRRPNVPSGVSNRTITGSRTFTAAADFTDPDYPTLSDGQHWETFSAKRVRVTRVSDNHEIHDSGIVTTTSTERTNARSSTSITLPSWDVEYRIHEQHRDRSGEWSGEVTYRVTARSGAGVDTPTSPSGRITDWQNPGDIVAVYRNSAGLNADRWKVGRFTSNGQLVESKTFNVNIAPNTAHTVTWANAEFGTPNQGQSHQIKVDARDTNGNWAGWSDPVTFTMNAVPNVPWLWGPPDGQIRSTIPPLGVVASDPDQDADDIEVWVEGFDESMNSISSHLMAHDPRPSNPDVFTTGPAPFVSTHGTYYWRSRVYDGYLTSEWSPLYSFTYAAVPAVTVTAPTGPTVTTSQPLFEWTSTNQTSWRLIGRDGDGTIVYDTGEQAGSDQQHLLSSTQYWKGGEVWNNYETFHFTVMVQDSTTLWGEAEQLTLTLEYIPPDPLIISVEAKSFLNAKGTHYGEFSWSQSNYTEGEFLEYQLDRVEIDGPAGTPDATTYIPYGEYAAIGDSADTMLRDFDLTANQWYRVGLRQAVRSGVDVIHSETVYAEIMVSWHGTLLHMPFDPINNHVWLNYGTERYEPGFELHQGGELVMPMNGRAPLNSQSETNYTTFHMETTFVPQATAMEQFNAFVRLAKMQVPGDSPTGRPETVCLREGRGGIIQRLYGKLSSVQPRYTYTRLAGATFDFTELGEYPMPEGGE